MAPRRVGRRVSPASIFNNDDTNSSDDDVNDQPSTASSAVILPPPTIPEEQSYSDLRHAVSTLKKQRSITLPASNLNEVTSSGPSNDMVASIRSATSIRSPVVSAASRRDSLRRDSSIKSQSSFSNSTVVVVKASSKCILLRRQMYKVHTILQDLYIYFAASRVWKILDKYYMKYQVKLFGMYSVERLQAYDDYVAQTSFVRVLSVCLLTPVPALCIILIMDAIPLGDPTTGWHASSGFWVRSWLTVFCMSYATANQFQKVLPQLFLTTRKLWLISMATAWMHLLLMMLIAAVWSFPVPFYFLVSYLPMTLGFALTMALAVRWAVHVIPELTHHCWKYTRVLLAQSVLVIVYPMYNALFVSLHGHQYQFLLVFVLPVLKLILKNVIARLSAHLEDYMPELTIFSVEVFNALYQATAMQNTGSIYTTLALTMVDVIQSWLSFRGLRRRTNIIDGLRSQLDCDRKDLMGTVLELCQNPQHLYLVNLSRVRLRSAIAHRLSMRSARILRRLHRIQHSMDMSTDTRRSFRSHSRWNTHTNRVGPTHYGRQTSMREAANYGSPSTTMTTANHSFFDKSDPREMGTITPGPTIVTPFHNSERTSSGTLGSDGPPTPMARRVSNAAENLLHSAFSSHKDMSSGRPKLSRQHSIRRESFVMLSAQQKTDLMMQTLKMLFSCEFLILVEYTECAIPVFYALYVALLSCLPNAKYYRGMRILEANGALESFLVNISVYTIIELGSFLVLHYYLKRKFDHSALYQLAFVLENQMAMVQGKLITWVVLILY